MIHHTQYSTATYDQLTKDDLYAILQLRQAIFVVEQACPYLDADGKDQGSYHVMMKSDDTLVGYTRLLPLGLNYTDYASIGNANDKTSKYSMI